MTMPTRRRLALLLTVAAVHFFASLALLFYVFGSGMARFDSGVVESEMPETVARWAFAVLSFPLLPLLERMRLRFPGWWGYIPFLANSALWGAAAGAIWRVAEPRTS